MSHPFPNEMALLARRMVGLALMALATSLWAAAALASSAAVETRTALVQQFGGPSSVSGTLNQDEKIADTAPVLADWLDGYFAFKKLVQDEYGLSFGFDYNILVQMADKSLGDKTAMGSVARAFGEWTLVGRGSKDTGGLVYKVERREAVGGYLAPKELGSEIGYVGLTAVVFRDDWQFALTNLYWHQRVLNNRLALVAGIVDVTDYVDVYGLVNPWTEFNNYAFTTDPTIPAPDQGLGAAFRVMPTESLYIVGGIADTNGDPTSPGDSLNSFFNQAEYFTHLEVGWVFSWERRFSDNIHLTAWHADACQQKGIDAGWGLAFSLSRLFSDTWEPFLRLGYAKDGGALWDRSVSTGIAYNFPKNDNTLGLGLNWSRPSEETFGPGLEDQYTGEVYFRFQATRVLSITPSLQALLHPALAPDEDLVLVFGLRARISF